ncbi:hypothetical protein L1987_13676 [Smallanthus sonchifolius]|uniref:Uncharacterized protein n=1 Tax=Smallanthus sonchifolius TaxID=185202 RepID=A0ACB9JHL9_9ASTR|nr:hypothetical protein L1987_13676 [Smallanthus sonchifolius]
MDNKVELLIQQYEHFNVGEHEKIDEGYARFNVITTSLKALCTTYINKNYVRNFFRALHPRWRAKVTANEESKDLNTLQMDELMGNLKVHEVIMKKDDEISKGKKEKNKSLALKAKHSNSSSEEDDQSNSDNGEEYGMAMKEFKKLFRRKEKFVRQPRNEKRSFNNNRISTQDEKKDKSKLPPPFVSMYGKNWECTFVENCNLLDIPYDGEAQTRPSNSERARSHESDEDENNEEATSGNDDAPITRKELEKLNKKIDKATSCQRKFFVFSEVHFQNA